MSAAEKLQEREASKRAELEQRLRDLRARREQATRDLQAARDVLIDDPSDEAKQACASAESLVHALDAKLAAVDRDRRKLDAFGDQLERQKFRARLDQMCAELTKLRADHRARAAEIGVKVGAALAEAHKTLSAMSAVEQRLAADATSLGAALDPTLTDRDLRALGAYAAGIVALEAECRRAATAAAKKLGVNYRTMVELIEE